MSNLKKLYTKLKDTKPTGWHFSHLEQKDDNLRENFYYVAGGSNPPLIFLESNMAPGVIVYLYTSHTKVHYKHFERGAEEIFDMLEEADLSNFPKDKLLEMMGSWAQAFVIRLDEIGKELAEKANHNDSLILQT